MVESCEMLEEFASYIAGNVGQDISVAYECANDELTLSVDVDHIASFLAFLRDDARCSFKMLIDLCGADYPERENRFDVVYHLLSLTYNRRVRVKVAVKDPAFVPTVVHVYSAAGWFEREVWDMYGIFFKGHPDLRRILTDYGFEGHPLRKDFPLTGYVQVRYDDEKKRVVNEPVSLDQEYRNFDFVSPWEGTDYVIPDEEDKAA